VNTSTGLARKILHTSVAEGVAALRRRLRGDRKVRTVHPGDVTDEARLARRSITLQETVERILLEGSLETALGQAPRELVDLEFLMTAAVAEWIRNRPRGSLLLDIDGFVNTRFLSGTLGDHCDQVWLCVYEPPSTLEIVSPIIVRTGSLEEVFCDGRQFEMVTWISPAFRNTFRIVGSLASVENPGSETFAEILRIVVDRAADRVANGGALLLAFDFARRRQGNTCAKSASPEDFGPAIALLQERGFEVSVVAFADGRNGWQPVKWALVSGADNVEPVSGVILVRARRLD
jgi:hypothetical protein